VAKRSKTKDKILRTSQALFNNEGESAVSAVDIASVMGISPGNLYYHYKGKDEIIIELFSDFEAEIKQVLTSPVSAPLKLEDNWIYLYIIFEEIYDFRFFYKNQSQLIERIPSLRGPFSRIYGFLSFDEGEKAALSGRLAQHFTFWLQYHDLRFSTAPPKSLIDQGVFQSLIQITPYWQGQAGYADLLREFMSDK